MCIHRRRRFQGIRSIQKKIFERDEQEFKRKAAMCYLTVVVAKAECSGVRGEAVEANWAIDVVTTITVATATTITVATAVATTITVATTTATTIATATTVAITTFVATSLP
jgi:hypothetical protein